MRVSVSPFTCRASLNRTPLLLALQAPHCWQRARSHCLHTAQPAESTARRKRIRLHALSAESTSKHIIAPVFNAQSVILGSRYQKCRRGPCRAPLASAFDRQVSTGISGQVVAVTSGAMILAAIHRVTFSVLAVPFAAEFNMTLPQMGVLQSAALIGYLLGQIPAGFVADRFGGAHVLLTGLALWSLATGANPLARYASSPLQVLVAMRVFLGLAQSVMMPSVSATAARWVPPQGRGKALSIIYACSSAGTVLGLAVTPPLAQALGGWPACFWLFAGLGVLWAGLGWLALPLPSQAPYSLSRSDPQHHYSSTAQQGKNSVTPPGTMAHIVALCWVHSVIGFGFFVLQSWIPTYLTHLGMHDLNQVGLLSGIPWVGTAVASVLAGQAAAHMQHSGWDPLRVRTLCQDVATLGPALSLVPLVVGSQSCSIAVAIVCLTGTLALQAFCYAGFHAYIQDVAPEDAGKLLGITNTCGTIVGILGNILTGNLAASKFGYAALFGLISCAYFSSFAVWRMCIRGQPIRLTELSS